VVSMTWMQYRHLGICSVHGTLVALTRQESEIVSILLMAKPNSLITHSEMIERVWPDPDTQPDTAKLVLKVYYNFLRKKLGQGIIISDWGRGVRLDHNGKTHHAKPKTPIGES
jgi:DNA-binding response OmpR family regulator